jgi:hypothetical protein
LFAIRACAVAIPFTSETAVETLVCVLENVPLAPLAGAAKMIVLPLKACPRAFLTIAFNGCGNSVCRDTDWFDPLTIEMEEGIVGSAFIR